MARCQGGDGYSNRAGRWMGLGCRDNAAGAGQGEGRGGNDISPGPAVRRRKRALAAAAGRVCYRAGQGSDIHVSSSFAMWIRARFLVLLSIFSSRSRHIFSWLSAAACSSVSFSLSA